MRRGAIPDVFVQDPKYFEEFESEIKQLFGEGIGHIPYVAIHLRVGSNPIDSGEPSYIDNPFYFHLSKSSYYTDAMRLFPDRKFLVFSDNMAFAKEYFKGEEFEFDDSIDDLGSFNKMSSCESFIIANSSFSWWAAYLSPSISKKVIAPSYDKWYSDGNTTRTVIPKNWIQI